MRFQDGSCCNGPLPTPEFEEEARLAAPSPPRYGVWDQAPAPLPDDDSDDFELQDVHPELDLESDEAPLVGIPPVPEDNKFEGYEEWDQDGRGVTWEEYDEEWEDVQREQEYEYDMESGTWHRLSGAAAVLSAEFADALREVSPVLSSPPSPFLPFLPSLPLPPFLFPLCA
jgi:hypothetical protein